LRILYGNLPGPFGAVELDHLPWCAYRMFTNEVFFSEAFKFAFIRNPIEKMWSEFNFKIATKSGRGFVLENEQWEEFIEKIEKLLMDSTACHSSLSHFLPQTYFVCEDIELFDFDRLATSWEIICKRLNIKAPLQKLNASSTDRKAVPDGFRTSIERLYAVDFDLYERVRCAGR
jgi:hypothetical protein